MVNKKMTHFNSQTGKVNMNKHPWGLYSDFWEWLSPKDDELWFSCGRINEVWQSGYDDVERRPYCTQRWPENWVEIHPDDAAAVQRAFGPGRRQYQRKLQLQDGCCPDQEDWGIAVQEGVSKLLLGTAKHRLAPLNQLNRRYLECRRFFFGRRAPPADNLHACG